MIESLYLIVLAVSVLMTVSRPPTWMLYALSAVILVASPNTSRLWNQFHYYLGSKYHNELGTYHLYECALSALGESGLRRNLADYTWAYDTPNCKATFTPERLQAFTVDLSRFAEFNDLRRAVTDKGLNATPPWLSIGKTLSQALTPKQMELLDPILLAGAFGVTIWAVGWRRAGLSMLWLLCFWGTFDRLWGNILQYGWLAASLAAVALLQRNRQSEIAGGLIGTASALAIFPAFLLWGRPRRVWSSALVTGMAMAVMGLAAVGVEGYIENINNMRTHSNYIRTETLNVGLANMVAAIQDTSLIRLMDGAMKVGAPYQVPDAPAWWVALLPAVLGAGWVGLLFGGVTLSRYYYTVLTCLILEKQWAARPLFAINAAVLVVMWTDPALASQTFNLLLFGGLATATIYRLIVKVTVIHKPLTALRWVFKTGTAGA